MEAATCSFERGRACEFWDCVTGSIRGTAIRFAKCGVGVVGIIERGKNEIKAYWRLDPFGENTVRVVWRMLRGGRLMF